MSSRPAPAWAISFADLCLLLLGFFIMLHATAGEQTRLVSGINTAFGSARTAAKRHELIAAKFFQPGEAVLTPGARRELAMLATLAARQHATVEIESVGADRGSRRFDGWELAAARTAAIARAIQAGGLREDRIGLSIPEMNGDAKGQRIAVTIEPGGK